MVAEFSEIEPAMRDAVAPLRRHTLVPGHAPELWITPSNDSLPIICGRKRYLLPAEDVTVLPLINTTLEALAGYLLGQVLPSCRGPDWWLQNSKFPSFRAPRPLPVPTSTELVLLLVANPPLDQRDRGIGSLAARHFYASRDQQFCGTAGPPPHVVRQLGDRQRLSGSRVSAGTWLGRTIPK
jgi:hypothetical protein